MIMARAPVVAFADGGKNYQNMWQRKTSAMASFSGGSSQISNSIHVRVQNTLSSSLPARCSELSKLIHEATLKELQSIFTTIVESIFGFRAQVGWGLTRLVRNFHHREFDSLRSFLAPEGTLLRLAYKLLGDGCPKYEFPVSCLPTPTRQILEEGTVPLLYSNKLQCPTPGCQPSSLQLNAFEFYIFHFAYLIVNPVDHKGIPNSVNAAETLYACLLEDYLNYFLPANGSTVPPLPVLGTFPPCSPQIFSPPLASPAFMQHMSSSRNSPPHFSNMHGHCLSNSPRPNPHQSLLRQRPSILKPTAALMMSPSPGCSSSGSVDTSQVETWRSETLIVTLTEMWLNQSNLDSRRNKMGPVLAHRSSSDFSELETRLRTFLLFSETFVPSQTHVWMVRIFIKHLHYFTNSARPSNQSTGYMPINALEQLKCTVLSQFVKKRLYSFLKLTFDHWPLDASFRIPLEAWLSYIQPWRYITYSHSSTSFNQLGDREDKVRSVDPKWQKFVTENVLFYSTIFQQMLPRFFRMDLSCPKNAYMLFRVTKVFAQINLDVMIAEAENSHQDHVRGSSTIWPHLLSQAMPASPHSSDSSIVSIQQRVTELEAPGFAYSAMFSEAVISQVSRLLLVISSARRKAAQLSCNQEQNLKGWFYFLKFEGNTTSEDYSPSDIKKIDNHLEASTEYLCYVFKLSPPMFSIPGTHEPPTPPQPSTSFASPERREGGPELTDHGRYQMMHGMKRFDVSYQGHPDLQPIRSFEIAFLVRILWIISSFLNTKFPREIQEFYYQPGVLGRMCQILLAPPAVYYKILKSSSMQSSSHTPVVLPPRVHLRFLAHKQLVCYLLGLIAFGYSWGFHPLTVVLIVIITLLFITFLKALFNPFVNSQQMLSDSDFTSSR